MLSIKKVTIIAALLITVGGLGCLFTFHQLTQTHSVSEEKTIMHGDFTSIKLETGNANVELTRTTGSKAKIELSGKEVDDASHRLKTQLKGSMLSIQLKNKHHFIDFNSLFSSMVLKVYIPEKQYNAMLIKNDNGKIQIDSISVKTLDASTDNGLIGLKNITSKKVNVTSNNGKITMVNVEGTIKGKTDNGKISVSTKTLDRPIELDSDNGRIDIQTDQAPTNVTFDVHVDNGHVNILDKYRENAVIGQGDNLIKLTTDNGSVNVTKK